eukprot:Skav213385  [mRNA]  locus=scaffold797:330873:332102:+ [translate_table: standard]
MLSHVSQTQALGFPNGSLSRQLLTHQDLDGRGFSGAVGTNHCHTTHLRDSEADVHDGGLILGRVGEAHVVHSQDDFASALHTFQGAGLREHELHGLVADFEVGLLFRVLLHELRQTGALHPLEGLQLPVLEVNDVGAHLVQEGTEMGGANDGAIETLQPVLQPLDVVHVQVTSGFIQHQHISVHQLGSTQLHLHLPAPRVGGHGQLQVCSTVWSSRVAETNGLHQFLHRVFLHRRLQLVNVVAGVHHPPPTRLIHRQDGEAIILNTHLLIFDLMLHKHGLQLITFGEALQLLVGNGAHQGGLAALIGTQQAIEAIPLQVHLGIPEQRQGSIGQREGSLVQVYAFSVLLLDFLLGLGCDLHLGAQLFGDAIEGCQVSHVLLPGAFIEDAHVGCSGCQRRHMTQLGIIGFT